MKRTLITPDSWAFPPALRPLLEGADVYDSSCSSGAKVYFIDREGGLFLKSAAAGALAREAEMTRFFHQIGRGAEVLSYTSDEGDWLLTRRIPGEDCTHANHLAQPRRLAALLGETLRALHETDASGCPVADRTGEYLGEAMANCHAGRWDASLFPDNWGYRSAEEAWAVLQEAAPHFRRDVLIHGDYCLPNVMLQDWQLSGFLDVGAGGMGDPHVDLFWGLWTLNFNLKTDRWGDTFLDAYGRDKVTPDMLRAVAAAEVFL